MLRDESVSIGVFYHVMHLFLKIEHDDRLRRSTTYGQIKHDIM